MTAATVNPMKAVPENLAAVPDEFHLLGPASTRDHPLAEGEFLEIGPDLHPRPPELFARLATGEAPLGTPDMKRLEKPPGRRREILEALPENRVRQLMGRLNILELDPDRSIFLFPLALAKEGHRSDEAEVFGMFPAGGEAMVGKGKL